jgi:hypothetical protein
MKGTMNSRTEWKKARGKQARALLFSLGWLFEQQECPFCPLCAKQRICFRSTERSVRKRGNPVQNNYCLWCPACLMWAAINLPMGTEEGD